MFFATDEKGIRIEASPSRRGFCPFCGESLIPRCGEILAWHWAHESVADCDSWAEGETQWHLDWKRQAPPDRVEVIKGEHRADILGAGEIVIELQHSSITPAEIAEREAFYGSMVWLIDGWIFRIKCGWYWIRHCTASFGRIRGQAGKSPDGQYLFTDFR